MYTEPHATQPTTTRRPVRWLLRLADLYAVLATAYFLLRLLTGYSWWPVRFASTFAHWLLLPALPLLIILLIARKWSHAAAMLPGALGFAILFGGLFLPNTPTASACTGDCRSLTVVTFNAASVIVPDMDAFSTMLREADADLVAIQELGTGFEAALSTALLDEYPYRVIYADDNYKGTGILSRYPIAEHELYYTGLEVFPYLEATLDVDGQPLTVLNAHPAPPAFSLAGGVYAIRAEGDIPSLINRYDMAQPTLILGDFNMPDQSAGHDMMREAGWQDAFREAGWGFGLTFPAAGRFHSIPLGRLVRIDYVWTTPHFTAVEVSTGAKLGSDHIPVVAHLRW